MLKVTFEFEKETKHTIRFKEAGVDRYASPKIGTLYVPKASLQEIGWTDGKELEVTLNAK